jgi:hypothetical protein
MGRKYHFPFSINEGLVGRSCLLPAPFAGWFFPYREEKYAGENVPPRVFKNFTEKGH